MSIVDPLQEEFELKENETLVDVNELPDNPSAQDESVVIEDTSESVTEQEEEVPEETKEDTIEQDPRFAGKSSDDLIKMVLDAQSMIGRQGQQIGDYRGILEDFIKTKGTDTQQSPNNKPAPDIYENPDEFVEAAISKNSTLNEMRELVKQTKQQAAVDKLTSIHPDWKKTIEDISFQEWVASSAIRTELAKRFDNYEYDAANELLSNWSERKQSDKKVEEVSEKQRKSQMKAASTGGKGSAEPPSRKIYKEQDLLNLMIKNPEKYRANVFEIDKAYAEGRVIKK